MPLWKRFRFALTIAGAMAASAFPGSAGATNGHWQPADLEPTQATLNEVRALYERGTGTPDAAYAERVERYEVATENANLESTATIADGDFRIVTSIDGADYESGRQSGRRWRRTPRGVTRIIESDVQGDDLDRWPLAAIGFSVAQCDLVGETRGADRAFVLAYAPEGEIPHWFYVDAQSGLVLREVTREGSRVVTYAFDDFRKVHGIERPYHWTIDGAGGPARVRVAGVVASPVPATAVAIPLGHDETFPIGGDATVRIPASFDGRAFVNVVLNGRKATFMLDTGSTQMLLDAGFAHRAGLAKTLGHTIVSDVSVGSIAAKNVPFLVVGLGGGWHCDGVLGNDFFVGHVLHLDFQHERLELTPHDRFVPPAGAFALPVSYVEGLPLVEGRIGTIDVRRIALDTGSFGVLVPRYLIEHDARGQRLDDANPGRVSDLRFLEGSIVVQEETLNDLRIGPFDLETTAASVEIQGDASTIDIPVDAIVGTTFLSHVELWFDYDGEALYAKPF